MRTCPAERKALRGRTGRPQRGWNPINLTKELIWQPLQEWNAQHAGDVCLLASVLDYSLE